MRARREQTLEELDGSELDGTEAEVSTEKGLNAAYCLRGLKPDDAIFIQMCMRVESQKEDAAVLLVVLLYYLHFN